MRFLNEEFAGWEIIAGSIYFNSHKNKKAPPNELLTIKVIYIKLVYEMGA
jgi:hypothetical protein